MFNKSLLALTILMLAASFSFSEENPAAIDPFVKSAADSLITLFNSGKHYEALLEINRYVLNDSANSEYFRKIADSLGDSLSLKESVKISERLLEVYPQWIRIEGYLIGAYYRLGNMDNFNKHLKAYFDKSACGDMLAEYNYNTLIGLDSNTIIFSNGDNDTFPFWYWQYIKGIRQDVTLINLSLLNDPYCIKALKKANIPISYADVQIDKFSDKQDSLTKSLLYCPEGKVPMEISTPDGVFKWDMPATKHRDEYGKDTPAENSFRIQDIMIVDIIKNNQSRRPVYFTITCNNTNLIGLRKYLRIEGLVYKLIDRENQTIDPQRLRINLSEKYKFDACQKFPNINHQTLDKYYRGPNYPALEKETSIAQNYRSAFLQLMYYFYQKDEPGKGFDEKSDIRKQCLDFNALSSNAKGLLMYNLMEMSIPEKNIPLPDIPKLKEQITNMLDKFRQP